MANPVHSLASEAYSAPYDLKYPQIFETRAYPRYNFDRDAAPAIVPTIYPKTPSLFSVAVTAESIGGVSGSQQGGATTQFNDFVNLFQANTHQGARKEVTLKTLYEDGLIREGLFISIGPHREPVLTRPQLRQDLPDGAVGLWSIMSWLMADVGPTFCIELSKGVGDFKASSLALTVLKNAVQREEFVDLYRQHCHSPLADDLAAPKPNTAWNMDVAAIADNAYVMKIYRNLRVFSLQVIQAFLERIRFTTGSIAAEEPIFGLRLLDGEFSNSGVHSEPLGTRQATARRIAEMIHPEYSVNYHADTLTTPSDYERDRNMRDLFLSSALFRVISSIIGYAGKTNLAIAMGQLGSEATVPRKLVPFAAFLLETELKIVANSPGVRVTLAQHYQGFSHVERERLKAITKSWTKFTLSKEKHPYYAEMNQLGESIDKAHGLQRQFDYFKFLRKREETGGGGPYEGLANLDM